MHFKSVSYLVLLCRWFLFNMISSASSFIEETILNASRQIQAVKKFIIQMNTDKTRLTILSGEIMLNPIFFQPKWLEQQNDSNTRLNSPMTFERGITTRIFFTVTEFNGKQICSTAKAKSIASLQYLLFFSTVTVEREIKSAHLITIIKWIAT